MLNHKIVTYQQNSATAARGISEGLAVLLVEPTAYYVDTETPADEKSQTKGKPRRKKAGKTEKRKAEEAKEKARLRGLERGSYGGAKDAVVHPVQPHFDPTSTDEGLHAFVHTGKCRRVFLNEIYGNKGNSAPSVPCCDVCDIRLFDRVRPLAPAKTKRQARGAKEGERNSGTAKKLLEWRSTIHRRDFPFSLWGPAGILGDDLVTSLSSVGSIETEAQLKARLGGRWMWLNKYGKELLEFLVGLDMGNLMPKTKKSAAPKRQAVNPPDDPRPAKVPAPNPPHTPVSAPSRAALPLSSHPLYTPSPTRITPHPPSTPVSTPSRTPLPSSHATSVMYTPSPNQMSYQQAMWWGYPYSPALQWTTPSPTTLAQQPGNPQLVDNPYSTYFRPNSGSSSEPSGQSQDNSGSNSGG
ncbi:hypothetical protein V5O48_010452 [Marasmius crinis-equi]|uniref:Uncharacterized protein n=1 Tax=Marasmius crinis-equi TaxID=585013 RepID=A0ABR3F8S9_9AGAR